MHMRRHITSFHWWLKPKTPNIFGAKSFPNSNSSSMMIENLFQQIDNSTNDVGVF